MTLSAAAPAERLARAVVGVLAAGLLLGTVAGCSSSGDPTGSEGGMGLPTVDWLAQQPEGAAAIAGTLSIAENGCFQLATADALLFAIWPEGFEHGGAEVVTASGGRIAAGDAVEGNGVTLAVPAVLELSDGPDGAMGSALGYCSAGTDVVLLSAVSDPG